MQYEWKKLHVMARVNQHLLVNHALDAQYDTVVDEKCKWANRVIRKVMKTQHQNPEFVHTQGEIKE
jgi:hypothetical protein